MKIVGSVSARWLVHAGAIEMSFTILLCYTLAVSLGHVKPWLPTISACGDYPPEKYFFRYGIFIGALLLEIEAFALYLSKRASKLTFILGAVAALGLSVVAVVSSKEDDSVHTPAAVIFFVLEDIMSILLTFDLLRKITWCSLGTKIVSSTIASISTLIRILLIMKYLTVSDSFPLLPIVEWSNTAAIVVYQLSLATDIGSLYAAIAEADSSQTNPTGTKSPPPVVIKQHPEMAGPLPLKKPVSMPLQTSDNP